MDVKIQQPINGQTNDDANFEVIIDSRRESDYLHMLRTLKNQLVDKTSECEALKIKLDQSMRDIGDLNRDLNESKLTMFQNNEDAKKTHQESMKAKKLEEDYVKLMSEYLNLSEQCEQYRQKLYDNYVAKTNAINNYDCLMSNEMLRCELQDCRSNVKKQSAELALSTAKLRNLEEENVSKDKCITELKKTLDDAKVTHKHEINVLQEYIHCLENTISSYEKTLIAMTDEQPGPSERDGEDELEVNGEREQPVEEITQLVKDSNLSE